MDQTTDIDGLTDRQRAILELERGWWKYAGTKETKVRAEFGVSMTTYYAELNRLLDDPAAVAADPVTVNRLRRLREARRAVRTGRSRGVEV